MKVIPIITLFEADSLSTAVASGSVSPLGRVRRGEFSSKTKAGEGGIGFFFEATIEAHRIRKSFKLQLRGDADLAKTMRLRLIAEICVTS